MKYIDADKLIAEIERRMTENCKLAEIAGGTFDQRAVEDNDILALIDSLQQEQPQVADASKMEQPEVDLEKEIKNYFKGFYMDLTDQGYILKNSDGTIGLMSVKDIARHFYELGLNARKEE